MPTMSDGPVTGLIKKCILVNYRIVPDLVEPLIPANCAPKLHGGFAIAGVCIIQFAKVRTKGRMEMLGAAYSTCAHRVAVVWKGSVGTAKQGTHIFQRQSSGPIGKLGGGWLFSSEATPAAFQFDDDGKSVFADVKSKDGTMDFNVAGKSSNLVSKHSGFNTPAEAVAFFGPSSGEANGPSRWSFESLECDTSFSAVFCNKAKFPEDSTFLDSAFIIRDVKYEWSKEADLYW